MTDAVSPILAKAIPDQMINEGSAFSVDLRDYIGNLTPRSGQIAFTVSLLNGEPLPPGIEYSRAGVISGIPEPATAQSVPYDLLIIAKNKADVPLIAEMKLWVLDPNAIHDEVSQDNSQTTAPSISDITALPHELTESFWTMFGENEPPHDGAAESDNWSQKLNDKAYRQLFLEYFLRKFSSLQIYNADYQHHTTPEATAVERSTMGWPIYVDGSFAIATSNPEPFASYLNREAFIQTVREMLAKAVEKGWKTVGVAGFDKNLGWRLIREYNAREKTKPPHKQWVLGFDDVFQDKEWVDQLFNNNMPTQQLSASDGV